MSTELITKKDVGSVLALPNIVEREGAKTTERFLEFFAAHPNPGETGKGSVGVSQRACSEENQNPVAVLNRDGQNQDEQALRAGQR